ncbi:hypothetical protein [Amycolatopsis sp. GM8]|uniref:hypothetical protein n=1 Tax=Amycolatopsis sp. GM8 TaxID=2896530 RepID=UPI001F416522|nr:hypothetical protein [Amycolatopsis sp. GM8]
MKTPTEERLRHPGTVRTFRNLRLLVTGYLTIGVLALIAIVLLRDDAAAVNSAVWTRAIIVVITAVLLLLFAGRAARGSRGAYWRLRIVSIVTPVAIAVIIALPGTFPLWMKIEQGVCGVVMVGVAVLANSRELRELFATG